MSGQVAGAVAYLAPPTSTLLLAFSTGEGMSWHIWVALVLVVGGAALGASARRKAQPGAAATASSPSPA
jgi:drug/metabolite transporter (DMT)-like permease